MQRFLVNALSAAITLLLVSATIAAGALAGTARARTGEWRIPNQSDVQRLVEKVSSSARKPSRIVYLHREALEVRGGYDDARARTTSLIAPHQIATVPRYRSSDASWQRLVTCVQEKFANYDVVITDRMPTSSDYILVKVGGRPADLGMGKRALGGVAPFHGGPIPNSMVFAFDQGGTYRTRNNCQTAAHEIGHVYGLDHTMACKDLMSYQQCGAKTFVNRSMACGEKEARLCEDRTGTQNSAQRLHDLLGPAREPRV